MGGDEVAASAAVVLDTVASFASEEANSMLENGSKVLGLVVRLMMLDTFFGAL